MTQPRGQAGGAWLLSSIRRQVIMLMYFTAAFVLWLVEPIVGLPFAALIALVCPLFAFGERFYLWLVALAVPYAIGAYLGALGGITFYPKPNLQIYWEASREQLTGLLLVAGAGMFLGIAKRFDSALKRASALALGQARNASALSVVIALGLGGHDLLRLIQAGGGFAAGGRHIVTEAFLVANSSYGIVLAMAVTVSLILPLLSKGRRAVPLISLVVLWAPSVLAGNRHYAVISGGLALALILGSGVRRTVKLALVAAVGLLVPLLFLLPSLWSDNDLIGFNEWILPNSMFLALFTGHVDWGSFGVTPLIEQWVLLLPGFLRPYSVVTFPMQFTNLAVVSVSVGGSPWVDAFVSNDPGIRIMTFVSLTLGIFVLGIVLARWFPLAGPLTFAFLLVWGRSLFWDTVFLIFYVSLLTGLVLRSHGAPRR